MVSLIACREDVWEGETQASKWGKIKKEEKKKEKCLIKVLMEDGLTQRRQ